MNKSALQIRQLIIDRRRECGIGLCGRYEAIANWLFKNHNVVTSTDYIEKVIKEAAL